MSIVKPLKQYGVWKPASVNEGTCDGYWQFFDRVEDALYHNSGIVEVYEFIGKELGRHTLGLSPHKIEKEVEHE